MCNQGRSAWKKLMARVCRFWTCINKSYCWIEKKLFGVYETRGTITDFIWQPIRYPIGKSSISWTDQRECLCNAPLHAAFVSKELFWCMYIFTYFQLTGLLWWKMYMTACIWFFNACIKNWWLRNWRNKINSTLFRRSGNFNLDRYNRRNLLLQETIRPGIVQTQF